MSAAAAEELGRLLAKARLPLSFTVLEDYAEIHDAAGDKVALSVKPHLILALNALPGLLAERAALVEEIERLRRELMAAVVADQEHGAGMSIILRNWRSRGKSDGDWRALDVSVQFGVGQPEISVISEYLCEGGVIDHAVHPGGIASARALVGGQADG